MSKVVRFSVSLPDALLRQFDELWKQEGHPTRSEAIKSLIRDSLVEKEWQAGGDVAGAIILVYDHHAVGIQANEMIDIQHAFLEIVISTQHTHLDHDNCLESIIVRGKADRVQEFVRRLKSVKGMKHVSLMMTTTGKHVH